MKYIQVKHLEIENTPWLPPEVYEQSRKEWERNGALYWQEYLKIRHKLPRNLTALLEDGFFHDARLQEIQFFKKKKGQTVKLDLQFTLLWRQKRGLLTHHDVSYFQIDYSSQKYWRDSIGDYLYGEILLDEHGVWSHDFLYTNGHEINIRCKKLSWKDIK